MTDGRRRRGGEGGSGRDARPGVRLQESLDPATRRHLGAHYTAEDVILRVLGPLLLDDPEARLAEARALRDPAAREARIRPILDDLAAIRILDPACGCGDFLLTAFRELRRLELAALALLPPGAGDLRPRTSPDQCRGIEILEEAADVAEAALREADPAAPAPASPRIVRGDALSLDWDAVVGPGGILRVAGNPPFCGARRQDAARRAAMARIFAGVRGAGVLDYAAAWFLKAADLMRLRPGSRTALVATSSVCQGEQTAVLWGEILRRGSSIFFARRQFPWTSDARNRAAVHCVITGFAPEDIRPKLLHPGPPDAPAAEVESISPYLTAGPPVLVGRRKRPLRPGTPEMRFGNMPLDGGHLILSGEERADLLRRHPEAAPLIRILMGAREFIGGGRRWCLWLSGVPEDAWRGIPEIVRRVERVRTFRLDSGRTQTRKFADRPALFRDSRPPERPYILVPRVSSDRRRYVPMGFLPPETIPGDSVLVAEGAAPLHFGIFASAMSMAWLRHVGGRLETDYRWSRDIVHNNFPWPDLPHARAAALTAAAEAVLLARAAHPGATMADLYRPDGMPGDLAAAHARLDAETDAAYGLPPGACDEDRMEILLALRERLLAEDG